MDRELAEFLHSERAREASPEALLLYLLMRADIAARITPAARACKGTGKLVTGVESHECATRLGITVEKAMVALGVLQTLGWVREGYVLGTASVADGVKWYALDEEVPEGTEAVRKVWASVGEPTPKERKPAKTREEYREASTLGKLCSHFAACHRKLYGEPPAKLAPMLTRVFVKRALGRCGNNEIFFFKFITWMFDNWEQIREAFRFESGERPTYNVLGTKGFFDKMREWYDRGLPARGHEIADRADAAAIDEAKGYGW